MKLNRGIKDVFEMWIDDTPALQNTAFTADYRGTNKFSLEHLTRDGKDLDDCMNYLKINYDRWKVFYRFMQRRSNKYPFIEYDTITKHVDDTHSNSPVFLGNSTYGKKKL